jgi:ElaB/YqjD/DUF883 family membrane-anchored ribosome-binding protein
VADEMTPVTQKTPEEIQQEMLQTRESLTEKVEALEHQVVGTVEAVKSFVTTAPETVSDTVKQAAAAVSESVKETFDITGHIRRHPLAAVGTAALLGCTISWLLSRKRESDLSDRMTSAMSDSSIERPAAAPSAPPQPAAPAAPAKPGLFDELFEMLGDKAKQLLREGLETASAALKESIQTQVPRLVNDMSTRLVDNAEGSSGTPFADRFDARRGSI